MINREQQPPQSVYWISLDSSRILEEKSNRLDAAFYSEDIADARILIEELIEKKYVVSTLGDSKLFSKLFWPGRFKRKYTTKEHGKPFLLPADVIKSLPKAHKYVVDVPPDAIHKKGWLLVSRSGTVGRTVIADNYLDKFVLSDDLIRMIPAANCPIGYVYAYMNTWIGQAFLTKTNYGMTVKHIEAQHVSSVPIPIVPELLKEVNGKILRSKQLREEANLLESEAILVLEKRLEEIANVEHEAVSSESEEVEEEK